MRIKITKPKFKPAIKIVKPSIPRPAYGKILGKKKKDKFAVEKKQLLNSIRKHSGASDTKLVGKALSFIATLPSFREARTSRRLVEKAFSFSEEKHSKQKRLSGEPYFTHAFQTAFILSQYGLDTKTIAAALLHDVLEDTEVSEKEIKDLFGEEVLALVKGVTKLGEYGSEEPELGEQDYLKDLLCASSDDVRVLLIKLADKIHNLRTIRFLPKKRRKEICRNALEVYAPLAERFGLQEMKEEIEDICFCELYPEKFKKLSARVKRKARQKEKNIMNAVKILSETKVGRRKKFFQKYSYQLKKKNIYAYFKKIEKEHRTLNEFYDFVVLVILCDTKSDCYEALRAVHAQFYPIPRKLKDYIAAPHLTYQSIHTSVIGPKGNPIKVFIRTKEMNELAEKGITVWLKEKAKHSLAGREAEYFRQISRLSSSQEEFVSALKTDFLEDQISLFGPRGEKITLPKGSTAIDFAFKLFPGRAVRLAQVEVNGRLKPVWVQLKSGDRIRPIFSKEKTVDKEWLDFAKTYYAREMIKDELHMGNTRIRARKQLRYNFTAKAKNGILLEIALALKENKAELESLSIERLPGNTFKGLIQAILEKEGSEKEIIERLGKIKGLKEIDRE